MTITTVGHGDQYTVTDTGRIIGVVIMTVGVGLFSTITAFLANVFVGPGEVEPDETAGPSIDPAELMAKMEKINKILLSHEKTNSDLEDKLERLESMSEKQDK